MGQSLGFIDDIAYGVQGQTDEENARKLQRMLEKAEEWRLKHGGRFETSKYLLVHFTRRRTLNTTAPIWISGRYIHPSQEAKYLGVIFDEQLRYKLHIQHIAKKGTKFALAIARITKSSWGPKFPEVRKLFTSVVAPRMDYAALIWHRPVKYGQLQRPPQITKLETAQRIAMKALLGSFRTTATAALEIETSLAPVHLRLQSRILRSITRFQTLPQKHPINPCIKRAATTISVSFTSPLEYLTTTFPEYMSTTLETIHPFPKPPWWQPTAHIDLSSNKKEAKQRHDQTARDPSTICIYTDGSGIEGEIGAAAYCPTTSEIRQQYLGKDSSQNVYVAELFAVKLAIDIVHESPTKYDNCII